jgi:ABC-type glycerol-3-phosphate transport system substrate-binding protein
MSGDKVILEILPEVQAREKLDLDLTTGTGLYDAFLGDEMYYGKFAKLQAIEPLDGYVAENKTFLNDFSELALATYTYGGKLYAIPWRTSMNLLAYRADLLKKYNVKVPSTYAELLDAATKVRQGLVADGQDDVYGIVARGMRGEGLNMWIIGSSILPALGGKWLDASGKPQVNSPEMVQGLAYYATLLQKAGSPDAPSMSWDDCSRVFFGGKAAFYLDAGIFMEMLYSQQTDVAKNVRTTLIPAGPNGRHAGLFEMGWAMNSRAKNKQEIWKLIKWLGSPKPLLSDAVDGGNFETPSASVLRSDAFAKRYPYAELNAMTAESRKYAREERPMIVAWPQVGDIVGEAAQKTIAGQTSAKDALDEAQTRILDLYQSDPDSFK